MDGCLIDADLSGTVVYHGIIHREYSIIKDTMFIWKTKCKSFAVAQHEADDEVPRVHCHILISEPSIQRDRFNEILKEKLPDLQGRKDFLILTKTVKKKGKPSVPYELEPLLEYMMKGDKSRLKMLENISPAIVEKNEKSWVETDKSDKLSDSSYMDMMVQGIVDSIGEEFPRHHKYHKDEDEITDAMCKYNLDLLFNTCRTKAFHTLYKQKSLCPPPSLYKRIAGSAFLRLCEKHNCLDSAVPIVQDKWYD